jgi:hypothetical protein
MMGLGVVICYAMRIFMALVALWLGAQVANAEEMCSSGFDKPATLSTKGEYGDPDFHLILKIDRKTETLEYAGIIGTGINGFQLSSGGAVE